jgi:hypothetical protein
MRAEKNGNGPLRVYSLHAGESLSSTDVGGVDSSDTLSVSDADGEEAADPAADVSVLVAVEASALAGGVLSATLGAAVGTALPRREGKRDGNLLCHPRLSMSSASDAEEVLRVGGSVPRGGRSCTRLRWVNDGVSGQACSVSIAVSKYEPGVSSRPKVQVRS